VAGLLNWLTFQSQHCLHSTRRMEVF